MFDERTPDFSDEPHVNEAIGIGETPPNHFQDEEEDEFDDDPRGSPFDSPLNEGPVGDLGGPEAEEKLDDIMEKEMETGVGSSGGGAGRRP